MWLFASVLVLGVVTAIALIASLGPVASSWTATGESWLDGVPSWWEHDDADW